MGRYSNPDIVTRLQVFSLVRAVTGRPVGPSGRFGGYAA